MQQPILSRLLAPRFLRLRHPLLAASLLLLLLFGAPTLGARSQSSVAPTDTLAPTADAILCHRIDLLLADPQWQRSQVAIYVYDLTASRPLYQHGAQQLMRPASTQKLLTSIVALDCLGGDHQFSTQLYVSGQQTDHTLVGDLIVRGGFDPLFGKDDMNAFVSSLQREGIKRIEGDMIFDTTMKDGSQLGLGWCWDDKEVPLTPLLYRGKDQFYDKFEQALARANIDVSGSLKISATPTSARLICTRSHTLPQVMRPAMKRSINIYAESMFYQLAAINHKPGATQADAAQHYHRFIAKIGHQPSDYQMADGSGLSLYNYLTPALLVDALRYAHANPDIYTHLLPTLPVMGRDGTLRSRCRGTAAQDHVYAKTGTVEGVSSLAGYARAANGHELCFAIINQGLRQGAVGRRFQDQVCRALCKSISDVQLNPDTIAAPAPEAEPLAEEPEEAENE